MFHKKFVVCGICGKQTKITTCKKNTKKQQLKTWKYLGCNMLGLCIYDIRTIKMALGCCLASITPKEKHFEI